MSEAGDNLCEAKNSLSHLVDCAADGEEILLSKEGKLSPVLRPGPRQPGGWEGRIRIAADFDAPLPAEVLVAFEGRG